jgi:hypothetical protein
LICATNVISFLEEEMASSIGLKVNPAEVKVVIDRFPESADESVRRIMAAGRR